MTRKFEIGDRVVLADSDTIPEAERDVGEIKSLEAHGMVRVFWIGCEETYREHEDELAHEAAIKAHASSVQAAEVVS